MATKVTRRRKVINIIIIFIFMATVSINPFFVNKKVSAQGPLISEEFSLPLGLNDGVTYYSG
ncbi:MAG TPA: hypothetical protein PKW33_04340 [Anaerolineaceae bacterium]|nr:hypothetical protein [Anaerolineaceae bacterium]HPN50792.1 hypothetical protein [Anaerolineaceae bacterium]